MSTNDQRLVFVGLEELVGVRQIPVLLVIGQGTFSEVGVSRLNRCAQRLETDAIAVELVGIGFHANRWARASPGEDLTDAFNLGKFLSEDGISSVIDLGRGNIVRGQGENQNGSVRGIDLAIVRLAGKIGRELASSSVDGRLNVARGGVDIATEIELESDVGGTEAAGGGHLRNAGDAAELALERSGHGGGHCFRAGTWQISANRDGREINLREGSNRENAEGHDSREKDRNSNERSGDGPTNEGRGEIGRGYHCLIPVRGLLNGVADVESEAVSQPIECEIDNRGGVKSEQLAEDQSANDRDSERAA